MKDLGFTETQQAIRSTIREYLEREVEPLVAEMEAERLLPYVPIRRMVAALGFGADGELTQMIKDSPPEEMLKFFVPRILSIEMSRICAGMALSHGASLGLCAGNVLSKGTPEQKERFAGPLLRSRRSARGRLPSRRRDHPRSATCGRLRSVTAITGY
jgi:acyl-CoA dehydrogenase